MIIEPTGIVIIGECEIQTDQCIAINPSPITAIWTSPTRRQINICKSCLEEMVRKGYWEIAGAKIAKKADISVYKDNQLKLIIEVKHTTSSRNRDKIDNWALKIHDNLLRHSGIPKTEYFMLAVYPQPFYLWKGYAIYSAGSLADYIFNVEEELNRFDAYVGNDLDEYQYQEEIIAYWIADIVRNPNQHHDEDWLIESGLYDAISKGSVMQQENLSFSR